VEYPPDFVDDARRLDLENRPAETGTGHPEYHGEGFADVEREVWDEHCYWSCEIGLDYCFRVDAMRLNCDYS
jgi:hypothetical protein